MYNIVDILYMYTCTRNDLLWTFDIHVYLSLDNEYIFLIIISTYFFKKIIYTSVKTSTNNKSQ